jgi:hypothetical protein
LMAPDGFDGRMSTRNGGRALRFVNVPEDAKLHLAAAPTYDGERQATYFDIDGSVSGVANAMLVSSRNPFAMDASCTPLAERWNAAACRSRYVSLRIVNGTHVAPATVTRDDGVVSRFDGYTRDNLALSVPVGHRYTFRPDLGAMPFVSVQTDGLRKGDDVTAVLPWNGTDVRALASGLSSAPVHRASSREELERCDTDAVWLDLSARQVYVRVVGSASEIDKVILLQVP